MTDAKDKIREEGRRAAYLGIDDPVAEAAEWLSERIRTSQSTPN